MKRLLLLFTCAIILNSCQNPSSTKKEDHTPQILSEIDKAKEMISLTNFEASIKLLENLKIEFPDSNLKGSIDSLLVLSKTSLARKQLAEIKILDELKASLQPKIKKNHDEFAGITWYRAKGTPNVVIENLMYMYMGEMETGNTYLRFCIDYQSDDWLFIQNYQIITDLGKYTITPKTGEVKRDNGSGSIWESYDTSINGNIISIVSDLLKSKKRKLRCNGRQYYKDRDITSKEVRNLQIMVDLYKSYGNNF